MRVHSILLIFSLASLFLPARGVAAPSKEIAKNPNPVAIEARIEAWPQDASFVESKGLTYDSETPNFERGQAENPTGYRILNLVLQPGEKVKFKLKSEENKVSMRAYIPDPPPVFEWRISLLRANKSFEGLIRSRMEVKNNTKDPQTLGLIVFGPHAFKYRVDLERIPATKKD